jgi:hypothetical protein
MVKSYHILLLFCVTVNFIEGEEVSFGSLAEIILHDLWTEMKIAYVLYEDRILLCDERGH